MRADWAVVPVTAFVLPAVWNSERRLALRWAIADVAMWCGAVCIAGWLRWAYQSAGIGIRGTLLAGLLAGMLHLGVGYRVGPYRAGQVRGSYEEITALAQTAVLVTPLLLAVTHGMSGLPRLVPGTVALVAGPIALTSMLGLRLTWRSWRNRVRGRNGHIPVAVFGAGAAARLLVRNLIQNEDSPYVPVVLLDDDSRLRGLRIEGIRVVGGRDKLAQVAQSRGVEHVVIAIPSATREQIRALHQAAEAAALRTLVVPSLTDLIGRTLRSSDIRDINLEDLLGRGPVTLDSESIATQIHGKVVLVSGAGGSIGSELCRQISRFGVGRLVLLDRDESALHALQVDLEGHGLLESDNIVLADIRDPRTLQAVFARHRPQVVFHAAALKHLTLLERYPLEAWRSNVIGTLNVLQAAADHGVETFINISTDKAAAPTSVLGYSKRIAERITADFSRRYPGRYLSVRFGNVLGSRGSVIPTFQSQIAQGGPVTVTHPNVERYFMLIPEASQLVLQAAALGRGGEVMVLDMGAPVRIVDVARALIDISGRHDVDIHFTGLRPGEKLSEDLFSDVSRRTPTCHELVSFVNQAPLDADHVRLMKPGSEQVLEALRHHAHAHEDAGGTLDADIVAAVWSQDAAADHLLPRWERPATTEPAPRQGPRGR